MKLLRVGDVGEERPAMVDAEGVLRSLSGVVSDVAGANLLPASLERLRKIDPKELAAGCGDAAHCSLRW